MKRDIMQRYDATAHIYNSRYADEQKAKIEAAMSSIIVERESSVLDVGCGTGILFHYLANQAKALVGLDISRKTILQAKRASKEANAHLVVGDADHLPFKGKVFNLLFAVTLIQNMPDPSRTLLEVRRVAEEDAFLIVTGLKKKFPAEILKRILEGCGLQVLNLKSDGLKCTVALCKKAIRTR